MNKEEEFEYSLFFIERLNKCYGLDYSAQKNLCENKVDGDVDIYAISNTNTSERINLQVVTRDGKFKKMMANQMKKIKLGKALLLEDKVTITSVKKESETQINHKENKYSNPEKLVLLVISRFFFNLTEKDYPYLKEILGDFSNSKFKGVYFVNPPAKHDGLDGFSNQGIIFILKSMFNDDKIIL